MLIRFLNDDVPFVEAIESADAIVIHPAVYAEYINGIDESTRAGREQRSALESFLDADVVTMGAVSSTTALCYSRIYKHLKANGKMIPRGVCCRIPDGIVRVSDAEIARIAKFLGMDEATFIANETLSRKAQNHRATKSARVARRAETRERAPYPDRRGLILKNTPEGVCVYLTSDNLCRINPLSRKAQNYRATKSTRVA